MRIGITSSLIATLLAATATAQAGIGKAYDGSTLPGDALLPPGATNLTAELVDSFGDPGSGLNDIRGIVRLPNGNYLVSDGPGGGLNLKHFFEINPNGEMVFAITQPFTAGGSGIGITGLGWDRRSDADSRVWGGRAKSLMSYDWQNQKFDDFFPGAQTYGLKLPLGFVGNNVLCTAIADTPTGQVFVLSDNRDGGSPDPDQSMTTYFEMSILGSLPQYQDPTPSGLGVLSDFDNGKGGCAYDPLTGTIWWNVDDRDNNTNPNAGGVRLIEMNMDGTLTGQVVQGLRTIGGRARGVDIYIDGNGNRVMAYVSSVGDGADNPLGLTAGEDILIEMYGAYNYGGSNDGMGTYLGSCGGIIGYEGQAFIGNSNWNVTLRNGGTNPLNAAILFRGSGLAPGTGTTIPGINNCELLISLGNFRNMGAHGLVNGEASFNQNLPDDAGLIGAEATFQWLLPTNANVLPLNVSDAGTIYVGTNM
ncbi:MAG: hypothetical protein ACYTG5_19685 [Planctomycetota bacterium]|jgi:hypothetical protein